MKKKIIILIFFTLAVINTIVSGLGILGIRQKTKLLVHRRESAIKLDRSLYDTTSLKVVVLKLEEEIFIKNSFKRQGWNTLKMTEDVLGLFKKNRIKVINYRLEGEENREELALTAEGEIGFVLKLIYDLSFTKEGFRIKFISVDARFPGQPATIVIRITYA